MDTPLSESDWFWAFSVCELIVLIPVFAYLSWPPVGLIELARQHLRDDDDVCSAHEPVGNVIGFEEVYAAPHPAMHITVLPGEIEHLSPSH